MFNRKITKQFFSHFKRNANYPKRIVFNPKRKQRNISLYEFVNLNYSVNYYWFYE